MVQFSLAAPSRPRMRNREIPYNYTSFSDREIVIRFPGDAARDTLNRWRGLLVGALHHRLAQIEARGGGTGYTGDIEQVLL